MGVLLPERGATNRRGTPVAPTFRASTAFGGSNTGATSQAVTVPAGASAGDIAIIVVNVGVSVVTTPAGWTLLDVDGDAPTSPNQQAWVYKKKLVGGDLGATVTFNYTPSAVGLASGACFKDAEDVGVVARFARNVAPGIDGGTHPRIPEIDCGPQDLIVIFGGTRSFLSTALTDAQLASAPSGFTLRDNRSNQTNIFVVPFGSWIAEGSYASGNMLTLAPVNNAQSYNEAGSLAVSPKGRRPTDQLPASLTNAALHSYGHSFLCLVPVVSGHGFGHISECTYHERIAAQLGTPVTDNNLGLAGGFAADIAGFAFGTVSYGTRAVAADTNFVTTQVGTWLSQSNRTGLVILDGLTNDAVHDAETASGGTTAKSRAGAQNALDATIRLLRSSSIVHDDDASIAYAGTWASTSVNDYAGGKVKTASVNGSTATWSFTGTGIDVILIAIDDSAFGTPGTTFSLTVDGSVTATGTTSNQMRKPVGLYNNSAYTQMCVPLRGLSNTSHTIVLTHTGVNTTGLGFDGYLIPSATPPWIVVNKIPHFDALFYSGVGAGSNVLMDTYSAFIDTIIAGAGLTDGKIIVYDPLKSGLWDFTTMINTGDYGHPRDTGVSFYAHEILRLLAEKVA